MGKKKKVILLCSLIQLYTGCTSKNLSPKWFSSKNLKHTKNQIIGYDQAEELNIAKQIALRNIAEMLQVDVTSTVDIESYQN